MGEFFSRGWRLLATGICFACFGAGGVLLGVLVFPVLRLCSFEAARRHRIARKVIATAFRCLLGLMRFLGVLTYELHGRERLGAGGQLILANHPTLVDVVLLMAFVQRADCIVKGALARNPITRGPVLAAGFVFNDSGGGVVRDCVDSLRLGNNLIVFPEGTRTPASGEMLLQRGAARIALAAHRDITPVRIVCTPVTLGKGGRWYHAPTHKPHFDITVGDVIRVAPFAGAATSQALAARRLTDHLAHYFSPENRRAIT